VRQRSPGYAYALFNDGNLTRCTTINYAAKSRAMILLGKPIFIFYSDISPLQMMGRMHRHHDARQA
jgi:hypothetical protein